MARGTAPRPAGRGGGRRVGVATARGRGGWSAALLVPDVRGSTCLLAERQLLCLRAPWRRCWVESQPGSGGALEGCPGPLAILLLLPLGRALAGAVGIRVGGRGRVLPGADGHQPAGDPGRGQPRAEDGVGAGDPPGAGGGRRALPPLRAGVSGRGTLLVAEVASRFESLRAFLSAMVQMGFRSVAKVRPAARPAPQAPVGTAGAGTGLGDPAPAGVGAGVWGGG